MIPDAVLHRYTELLSQQPIVAEELALFISWDAQLLASWCQLLDCDPMALATRITQLDSGVCADLGLAVVMAQVPAGQAARATFTRATFNNQQPRQPYPDTAGTAATRDAGMDEWSARLADAVLGGLLAASQTDMEVEYARRLCLLALAEEPLSDNLVLQEMIEFRGEPAEYLRDAHPMLQVFCVVDAYHNRDETAAAQAAETLLNCAPEDFSEALLAASEHTDRHVEFVLHSEERQGDWQDGLWERLRILALSGAIARATTTPQLLAANRLVAGDLFDHEPLLLRVGTAGHSLQAINLADADQLKVDLESTASRIAASVRSATVTELIDRPSSLVAERQLLRRLGTSAAFVHPLFWDTELVGVCVFARPQGGAVRATARRAYAQDLAEWFGRASSEDPTTESTSLQSDYSTQLEKRLREIVHEANNPLSVVRNYLHILDMRLPDNPRAQEQIQLISDELRRASDVIRQVIDVPRDLDVNATIESTEFDLNVAAEQVCDLIGAGLAAQSVRVRAQVDSRPILLNSDRDRVVQVLSNLVKNAVEALLDQDRGGDVAVRTAGGVYRAGREGVEVRVSDTAGGLSSEVLRALFDPKTSTKGGTHEGLGLHIVKNLVDELQGEIDVRTRAGEGTEFAVFLPLITAEEADTQ